MGGVGCESEKGVLLRFYYGGSRGICLVGGGGGCIREERFCRAFYECSKTFVEALCAKSNKLRKLINLIK